MRLSARTTTLPAVGQPPAAQLERGALGVDANQSNQLGPAPSGHLLEEGAQRVSPMTAQPAHLLEGEYRGSYMTVSADELFYGSGQNIFSNPFSATVFCGLNGTNRCPAHFFSPAKFSTTIFLWWKLRHQNPQGTQASAPAKAGDTDTAAAT